MVWFSSLNVFFNAFIHARTHTHIHTHRPIPCCAILEKKMWCYSGVRHSTDTKEMQEIVWEFMPVFSNLLKALSFLLQCVIVVCSERSNARAHTHTLYTGGRSGLIKQVY